MGKQLINLADIDVNEKLKDIDLNEKYQNRGVYNVMNYLNNYLIIIYDFYKINLKNSKELSDQCHLLSLANGLSMYGKKNRCYKDNIFLLQNQQKEPYGSTFPGNPICLQCTQNATLTLPLLLYVSLAGNDYGAFVAKHVDLKVSA